MASRLRRPRFTGSDTAMSPDLAYLGQEQLPVEGRGGDGSVRRAAGPAAGEKADLGACQDSSSRSIGSTLKEWNPFFSCNGEDNDPPRVVVKKKPPVAARRRKASSAAGEALSSLLPKAFAKPSSASREQQHKKAASEGDDNAELAFSVPPSVKAALARCAAQSRERVAGDRAAAAGGGARGTRSIRRVQLAAPAGSGGLRPSPVTPSLTPYATEHSTVSVSSEHGDKCFFTAASANISGGNSDAVGGGGGGGGDGILAAGRGDSCTGGERNEDVGVALCDAHTDEDSKADSGAVVSSIGTAAGFVVGSGEDIEGRRGCHVPEAPACDARLLGRRSGRHEPMGSGDIDNLLTNVLVAEGGEENGPAVDERISDPCARSGDEPCFSTSCDRAVGGDYCCAEGSPGSAGGIAAAATAATGVSN